MEEMSTNPLQLFRYSALTFNCHRIHYDRAYATQVEGYPGLVVHGPLLATWLSLFATKKSGRKLKKFSFMGKRPVFDLHHFTLSGENSGKDTAELRVLDHQLQLAVSAEAEFVPQ
jgi:3-methylfumaryl-CoA hydratase